MASDRSAASAGGAAYAATAKTAPPPPPSRSPAQNGLRARPTADSAGQPVPESDAELARCIFDSLALLYARVLNELAALRGHPFSQLHIVGGGCQNTLLNQLCADACGIAVVAGPIEASTLGNIGIQLMTLDELANVDEFRQVVRGNAALTTFTPNPDSEIARFVAQFQPQQTKELCA
ncbi:FGGY-family carbohydrate kinase [Klebsiella pneumoniae]